MADVTNTSNWRYSPEELTAAVRQSKSFRETLGRLGLSKQGGGAYATLHRRIEQLDLDTSHFTGRGWNAGNAAGLVSRRTRPLEALLVRDSAVTNHSRLKARIMNAGLLIKQCAICGLEPRWNGQDLVLRLDHVNGDRTDNRIENLRLVCPNCDSQLPTFAGRNSVKRSLPARDSATGSAVQRR